MSGLEDHINGLLSEYIRGPEGRKSVSRAVKANYLSPNFNKREYAAIAEELKNAIIDAYLAQVKTPGMDYFDRDAVQVIYKTAETTKRKDGKTVFEIVFSGNALYRPSLIWDTAVEGERGRYVGGGFYAKEKDGYATRSGAEAHGSGEFWQLFHYTGPGVYDIIGLFTNGWGDETTPYVYGYWADPETGDEGRRVRNLNHRKGSPFVKQVIRRFRLKYPFIEIEYPALWGGTLQPRGEWKHGPKKVE